MKQYLLRSPTDDLLYSNRETPFGHAPGVVWLQPSDVSRRPTRAFGATTAHNYHT